MTYIDMGNDLVNILHLKEALVGIKFLEDIKGYENYEAGQRLTYCQFLMKARKGKKLLASGDNIACANGASALGFRPVPEKLLSGDFLATLGTFTRKGAEMTMKLMPRLELNKYKAVAVAPLEKVDYIPDVIVIESSPEPLMWLALATIYEEGGRLNFNSSISNGTCVDITVVPFLEKKLNVTLGCYGCRNATDIPDEHLLAGFPGDQLETMVYALKCLQKKAMPRTKEKRAFNRLKNFSK